MMARPSANRREAEKKARRASIVDCAVRLFANRGYHRTRLEEIAEAAGFSKSGLYLHFPDGKPEIRGAVLRFAVDERHRYVCSGVLEKDVQTPVELVEATWTAFDSFAQDRPDLMVALEVVGQEDVEGDVPIEIRMAISRAASDTFKGLGGELRRVSAKSMDADHAARLSWTLWAFYLGLRNVAKARAHMGASLDLAMLRESALNTVLIGLPAMVSE